LLGTDTSRILEKDKYIMGITRVFPPGEPIIFTEGKGAVLKDINGKEYIDLFGYHAVASVGYCHPKVVDAIKAQAEKLISLSIDFNTLPPVELAEKLVKLVGTIFPNISQCFFLNSGSEAVELSQMLAKKSTGKYGIISLYGGFHGRTIGARSATGHYDGKRDIGPFDLPGVTHAPSYYCYRCSLGIEYPSCKLQCAKMLDDVITYGSNGEVAAFIAEPVQGTAGVVPAPDGYFKEIKKILDKYNILFIDDEVITGFGKTGKLFGIQHYEVEPDIMTVAKALGGGAPISAVLARSEVSKALVPWDYFTTFGGNQLSCAAASAALDVIVREDLPSRAANMGEQSMKVLKELMEKYEIIGDVRGKGMLMGVELVKNRRTKEPAKEEAWKLKMEAKKKGVFLPSTYGWLGNVIRIHPPLVITEKQMNRGLEVLEECLRIIAK
jgi:4-aminobutyrate aminotransferase/(S)-3-amino-2-methylpropionate transaminase